MTILHVPLKGLRVIVTALVVLDLAALAAFAVHSTTQTIRTVTPESESTPTTPSDPTTSSPPVTAPNLSGIPGAVASGQQVSTSTSIASRHHHGSKPRTGSAPVTPPKHTSPPITDSEIGACPYKLATPKEMGGLQSLVTFAPAFGPFSAEAFAAASAYQPELELLGPILAQYPGLAPKLSPLMTPLLSLFAEGSNKLFDLISPVYSPNRKQVLESETKLAAFFAPYSEKLAGSPVAGCVVDLEAALVGDTNKTDKIDAELAAAPHAKLLGRLTRSLSSR